MIKLRDFSGFLVFIKVLVPFLFNSCYLIISFINIKYN